MRGTGGRQLLCPRVIYDYPHLIMLYFHLYQIARMYPGMTKYLDQDGYLERAFGTAKAHFTLAGIDDLPAGARGYWAYTLGLYNELLIVDLVEALYEEGRDEQADWLKKEWEKKVKYFVYDDPYPFDSEYPFDTTVFESSHAIARYGLANRLSRTKACGIISTRTSGIRTRKSNAKILSSSWRSKSRPTSPCGDG
jgi:hypothetical protein